MMTRNLSVLSRVSSLAIAAVLTAGASAQSFLGDPTVTFGSVNIFEGVDTTDFDVQSPTAVIDWVPDDNEVGGGAINFQPSGTTATFNSFNGDYAVLNRIGVVDPSRLIGLNGTIQSFIGGESVGGNIFFYSPSGFVIGSSAVINVGSLVLSASPIFVDDNGNFLGSNGTTVTFEQAPNSNASITTAAGSQINANGAGSYVALVAPQITHRGVIRTDGAAALVAVEAATITFSPDGLFDIQVTVGTDAGTGVHVDGGTITRNNPDDGGNHRAYLVAVAKNDAVAMLINNGASIGFETATSAAVEDNVVVLSGGRNVSSGQPTFETGAALVNLAIDSSAMSSDVFADVTGDVDIRTQSGDTSFGGNLTLYAGFDSFIEAINGNTLSIGGTLFANLDFQGAGTQTIGNLLRITASGSSTLTVGGDVLVSAVAYGADDGEGIEAGDATGGTVIIQTGSGSTIDIAGDVDINVDGYGGNVFFNPVAGNGTGGTAQILANGGSGSSLTVGGTVNVSANGFGGTTVECSSCLITGGDGTGGNILLQALTGSGNQLMLDSDVTLTAAGFGGAGDVAGGNALGGNVQLHSGDSGSITIGADLGVDVSADGGFGLDNGETGGQGGAATGGYAAILFSGPASSISLGGTSTFNANAFGGDGVAGGNATGGWVNLQASSDGTLTANFLGGSADAFGGESDVFFSGGGATGGSATGGLAWVQASGGASITVNDLSLSANGTGGEGNSGAGGAGTGGHVIASANNASLTVANLTDLEANGEGGTTDDDASIGGLGTGGEAEIFADNGGMVRLDGSVAADADGQGGHFFSDDSIGGDGLGGIVSFRATNGATLDAAFDVDLTANGAGGVNISDCGLCGGTGGDGTGGTARITAFGGDISIGGSAFVDVSGFGGSSRTGGDGIGGGDFGTLTGGAHIFAQDGDISIDGSAVVVADGFGGNGLLGGDGGNGTGGWATIHAGNGDAGPSAITIQGVETAAFVSASGYGGDGGDGIAGIDGEPGGTGTNGGAGGDGGDGGTGVGGTVSVTAGAGNGTLNIDMLFADATAEGGDGGGGGNGGAGGDGDGGAGGNGGAGGLGGAGGTAIAGLVTVGVASGSAQAAGSNLGVANLGNVEFDASAQGGTGGEGGFGGAGGLGTPNGVAGADGNGGDGGNADGGTAILLVEGGTANIGSANLVSIAAGGDGGSGAVQGNGGNAESDEARVLVTNRLGDTGLRGTLNGGQITGSVFSTGGAGLIAGTGLMEGGSAFVIENGDATIDSLDFNIVADGQIADLAADSIAIVNGTVVVNGGFSFNTAGVASVYANNGTLNAAIFEVAASNFVHDPERAFPASVGTISADTFNLATGQDLIIDANLISTASLDLSAPGLIDIEDATSGGELTLNAGSSISGGSMTAAGLVDANAGGDIGFNLVIAGTDITMLSTAGSIFANALSAGGPVDLHASSEVSTGDITSGSSINVLADNGGIGVGDLLAQTSVDLNAPGAIVISGIVEAGADINIASTLGAITAGNMSADGDITVSSGGNMTLTDLTAGSDVLLDSGASMSLGNVTAQTGSVQASAIDVLSFLSIIAGTFVTIDPTEIIGGDITALAGDITLTGGSIDVGNLDASDNVILTAEAGDLSTGTVVAGIDVTIDATGDVTTSHITAGGLIDATGASLTLGNLIANSISLTTTVADLTVGNVTIPGDLDLTTAGDLVFGDLDAFSVDLAATGSITGGDVDSTTDITAAAGADIDVGDFSAGGFDGEAFHFGDITVTAGGDVSAGLVSAAGAVTADAGGAIATLDIDALDAVDLTAGTSIAAGNVTANTVAMIAGADITAGDISAFGSVLLDAGGSLIFGDIAAFVVNLSADGSIDGGNIDSETDIFADAGGDVDLLDLLAGGTTGEGFFDGSVALTAGGSVNTGIIDALGSVEIGAGGAVGTGNIDAATTVGIFAANDIATGGIFAGGNIDIFSTGGGIATGDLAGAEIDLEAGGDISFGNVDADSLDFDATGAVTGGDIVAFSQVGGEAQGAVTLGDITVGPGVPQVDYFSVGIASATSITVGNVSGTDRIGFATFGDLTTGNLSASDLVMALVGGDIVTGSITTAADGTVYMGDASMYIDAGGGEDAFDPSLVLALDPVATGGSITIGGPVSTGLFQAAAGEGLTTGAIDAQTIEASAGGTATLNGVWSAETVTLASNDIDITGTGGISGSGLVTLISTNATQALIGDGLTGTGYALSNAEFGRIEGGSVYILARGDASAAIDMLIGDLTVTGPAAGSTIENSEGILVFATGDVATQTPGGVIRVVGDVSATGFGAGNAMEFYADRFELDAVTGSISITSSGTTLGGELGLYASQIHVASGEILDQLAVDPQYDGYQDDLNAPAAVQRPEGVLNAGVIWIESDNLQSILIQNTGTTETPAGFLANEIFVNEDFEVAGPPGSIDVVVNGQLITETGTLTGVEVRDALVAGEDLTPFTANSTINGCLLVGPCGVVAPPEPPFPPGFTPTPGIQNEVVLIKHNLLPPPEFGNEDFIDDNNEITDEGATSPIKPPHPLFDTSALGDKGDVNDPVSGSGNPALMETPAGSPPAQEKQP